MKTLHKIRIVLNGLLGPLPCPRKWVFVVGCYNSGTTFLHNLLASHPDVGSMPDEGQFYTDQLLLPRAVKLPRLWAIEPEWFYMDENSGQNVNLNRLKRQWGARYNDPTRPVLLEKSPTNAARTLWLQKYFENAYFIGIIRNGYAVAEGIRRKAGHPLKVAAAQWARSSEIMLRDFDMLCNKKLIRYETLTDSPKETFRETLEFLDLDPGELCIKDRVWQIHEQTAQIRNMNDRSFSALGVQDRQVIESVAGDFLNELGYEASG